MLSPARAYPTMRGRRDQRPVFEEPRVFGRPLHVGPSKVPGKALLEAPSGGVLAPDEGGEGRPDRWGALLGAERDERREEQRRSQTTLRMGNRIGIRTIAALNSSSARGAPTRRKSR